VEVKIGVQHSPREVSLESDLSPDEVESLVSKALADQSGVLNLTDEKGRKILVPSALIAYVEIAHADVRRVGFTAG
jgi:hypothetical protein